MGLKKKNQDFDTGGELMTYICADRGSEKCPCILMEAGQCYTCSMIQTGKCSCMWQGICPYTEYKQAGENPKPVYREREFVVTERKDFSPVLTTVTLKVPLAYAFKCREPGSFIIVRANGWQVPLSVMKSYTATDDEAFGTSEFWEAGRIVLAVNAAGPKTIDLLKRCSVGSIWSLRGPYFSGLVRKEIFNPKALSIVAARGMAIMPLINMKQLIGGNLASFCLDSKKLPESFKEKYLADFEYETIDLENDIRKTACDLMKAREFCIESTGLKPNLLLMVSPYYAEALIREMNIDCSETISPNNANVCCGEGICGACSHTGEDGITVRACKCFEL
ncbi:MAG: hypothetical protein DBY08_05905 [Clostridiales bacterium]|nr:hypothetical protein [Bacillota bacterium]PWL92902.1 MAG: hypothetical protein DBY08_05905 [Clostridiales bacterium]